MPATEALKLVEDNLESQIGNFSDSRLFYRDADYYLTLATAGLSAATTVFIGAKEIVGLSWLPLVALICSAGVTVATAYNGFLRPKDLWVSTNGTLVSLRRLKAKIKYDKAKSSEPLSQAAIDAFQDELQSILDKANDSWKSAREQK